MEFDDVLRLRNIPPEPRDRPLRPPRHNAQPLPERIASSLRRLSAPTRFNEAIQTLCAERPLRGGRGQTMVEILRAARDLDPRFAQRPRDYTVWDVLQASRHVSPHIDYLGEDDAHVHGRTPDTRRVFLAAEWSKGVELHARDRAACLRTRALLSRLRSAAASLPQLHAPHTASAATYVETACTRVEEWARAAIRAFTEEKEDVEALILTGASSTEREDELERNMDGASREREQALERCLEAVREIVCDAPEQPRRILHGWITSLVLREEWREWKRLVEYTHHESRSHAATARVADAIGKAMPPTLPPESAPTDPPSTMRLARVISRSARRLCETIAWQEATTAARIADITGAGTPTAVDRRAVGERALFLFRDRVLRVCREAGVEATANEAGKERAYRSIARKQEDAAERVEKSSARALEAVQNELESRDVLWTHLHEAVRWCVPLTPDQCELAGLSRTTKAVLTPTTAAALLHGRAKQVANIRSDAM